MLIGVELFVALQSGIKARSSHTPVNSFQIISIAVTHHPSKKPSIQTIIQIMNILSVFVLFVILLKCVAASGDDMGVRFRKAVDGGNFGWLNANLENWKERRDLLDYVIEKGADFTARIIQNIVSAKGRVLAALFDKGEEGMIDDVLEKVRCNDFELGGLTNYRPELAGSPEKFFRVLDRIEDPKRQEEVVRVGVYNLLKVGRHDLVAPLVNALGKRTSNGERLKDVAIQRAFVEGAGGSNQYIVEEYYEHHTITSGWYAYGLRGSWNDGKPNQVFQFLLRQADQGDLDKAKEGYAYKKYEKFRQAIDEAPKVAPSAGSRIISVEKVQRVLDVLAPIIKASDKYGPSSIIEEHLLGETEKTKKGESEEQEAGTKNRTD
jgi:hypothetical protein